jgi:hypothetical protein
MTGEIKVLWVCWLLSSLGSCRPSDGTMPPLAVLDDTTALAREVDSSRLIGQDGLNHVPLHTSPHQQLPPELTQLLHQDYPDWVLPALSAEDLKQTNRQAQGPYFVNADFDHNGIKDFAVQLQVRDTALVAAYLRQGQGQAIKIILDRQPLTVVASKPGTSISLAGDSIVISTSRRTRFFAFKEGRLRQVYSRKEGGAKY